MPPLSPSPLPTAASRVSTWRLDRGSWATRAPAGRRFYQMLAASLLAHLVLTPAPAWLGLLGSLNPFEQEELPPEDTLTGIPIDILTDEAAPEVQPAPAPPPPPPSAAVALPEVDPAAPAPAPPAPSATPPEPPPEDPAESAKKANDPVALAGAAGKLADSNANVRILLYTDVVRGHALGPRIGELLRRTPQWSDFFGPTGVDPIRDIDRVLIAGPELRDTKNIVAVVGHHLPEEEIDRALERLVEKNGEWISKNPKLARATADRATRLFAAPRKGIVAVAPLSVEKSLAKLGRRLSFPEAQAGTAATAYVVKPSKPLRALGFRLPESIAWLSIRVVPEEGGGVTLELEAEDESPASASEHAETLEVVLRRASEIDLSKMGAMGALAAFALGSTKQKVVESIELEARDSHIHGVVRITARQLQNLADLLDAILPPPSAEKPSPRPEPAPAPEAAPEAAPTEAPKPAEAAPAPSPKEPDPVAPAPTAPSTPEAPPTEEPAP